MPPNIIDLSARRHRRYIRMPLLVEILDDLHLEAVAYAHIGVSRYAPDRIIGAIIDMIFLVDQLVSDMYVHDPADDDTEGPDGHDLHGPALERDRSFRDAARRDLHARHRMKRGQVPLGHACCGIERGYCDVPDIVFDRYIHHELSGSARVAQPGVDDAVLLAHVRPAPDAKEQRRRKDAGEGELGIGREVRYAGGGEGRDESDRPGHHAAAEDLVGLVQAQRIGIEFHEVDSPWCPPRCPRI